MLNNTDPLFAPDNDSNWTNIALSGDAAAIAVLRAFNFWLLLFIIVIGFSGNIFAVAAIWSSSKLRRISSNHYLVALALSDSVFVFGLFMIWVNKLGAPTYHFNTTACKCVLFLLNSSGCLSSWYVMVLTAERFVVVYYPLYRRAMCSIGRTRRTIAALVPWPLLFNVWVLFAGGLNPPHGICDILPEYYQLSLILNGVDMVVSFVIPVLAIVAFNTAICIRLWSGEHKSFAPAPTTTPSMDRLRPGSLVRSASKTKKVPTYAETDPDNKDQVQMRALKSGGASPMADAGCSEGMQKHAGANAKIQNQERKITKTLLIISFVYVALNMPSYSIRLRDSLMVAMGATASDMSLLEKIARNLFLMIYYMNFALNFIVYSLSSKNFRSAVVNLWCKKRRRSPPTTSASVYSHASRSPLTGLAHGTHSPSPSPYPSARNSPHLSIPSTRRMFSPSDRNQNLTSSTLGLTISNPEEDETEATTIADSQCANGTTATRNFLSEL